ncbi:EamA family transporter [Bacillus cereus]
MFYGGILLLIASIIVEQPNVTVLTSWRCTMAYFISFIFIGSIGGHGLYYWLLSKTNPVFPSTWLYVSPLIAIIVGYIILGEPLNPIMGMGLVLY